MTTPDLAALRERYMALTEYVCGGVFASYPGDPEVIALISSYEYLAARLAVEGQERAKIVNKVLWEISAAKDFSELASKLDLTRSEYWQARCDALDDLRPAIASLAHLDEKGTDDA